MGYLTLSTRYPSTKNSPGAHRRVPEEVRLCKAGTRGVDVRFDGHFVPLLQRMRHVAEELSFDLARLERIVPDPALQCLERSCFAVSVDFSIHVCFVCGDRGGLVDPGSDEWQGAPLVLKAEGVTENGEEQ
jgi:hypothetical protein